MNCGRYNYGHRDEVQGLILPSCTTGGRTRTRMMNLKEPEIFFKKSLVGDNILSSANMQTYVASLHFYIIFCFQGF